MQKDAISITASALNDAGLCVVRSVIIIPLTMRERLDDRMNQHTTASRILKTSELMSLNYRRLHADMHKNIEKMIAWLE